MYYLKKNKFFKRKDRKYLYYKYTTDYTNFIDLCATYERALARLDHIISKNILKTYIYNYLIEIRTDVADSRRQTISYTYQNCVDLKDTPLSVEDYKSLQIKTEMLSRAIGKIYAALDFVAYLENRGLDLVTKEGD